MNPLSELVLSEGWPRLGIWLAGAIVLALLDCELPAFISLVVAGILTWMYRKPVRSTVHFEPGAFTSPCDGRVSRVQTKDSGENIIEIETGCLDASVLCSPFEAEVSEVKVVRGARLRRKSPLWTLLNEHGSVQFQSSEGHAVHVTHKLSRESAPLCVDLVQNRAHVLRGTQYGVMTSGTTHISLPASVRIAVNPGEKVRAVETLLGYLG